MDFSNEECAEIFDQLEKATKSLAKVAGIGEEELEAYYVPLCQRGRGEDDRDSSANPRAISEHDAMWQFARSLQNSGRMSGAIGFSDDYLQQFEELGIIAEQSNGDEGCLFRKLQEGNTDEGRLSEELSAVLGKKDGYSLRKYARGLIDAASFLAKCDGLSSINAAIVLGADNPPRSLQDINQVIEKVMKIYGLGPALARDFLKECGCIWLAKPDVHIIGVLQYADQMGLGKDAGYFMREKGAEELCDAVFKFSVMATKGREGKGDPDTPDKDKLAPVTPYKVDKMIWLLCTGNFYLQRRATSDGGGSERIAPLGVHGLVYSMLA